MKAKPRRTCIGCREKKFKEELLRLYLDRNDEVIAEVSDKGTARPTGQTGRGAYLCQRDSERSETCLRLAIKNDAFQKAFRQKVRLSKDLLKGG
jgi:hypothetical protein